MQIRRGILRGGTSVRERERKKRRCEINKEPGDKECSSKWSFVLVSLLAMNLININTGWLQHQQMYIHSIKFPSYYSVVWSLDVCGCIVYVAVFHCTQIKARAHTHTRERTNRRHQHTHIRMYAQARTQKNIRSESFGSQELNCTSGSFKKKMRKFLFHFIDHCVLAIRLAVAMWHYLTTSSFTNFILSMCFFVLLSVWFSFVAFETYTSEKKKEKVRSQQCECAMQLTWNRLLFTGLPKRIDSLGIDGLHISMCAIN